MDLHRLVYVSSAKAPFSPSDLEALLAQSRAKNKEVGVTGALVHCDGNFMQLLEGPKAAVLETFARIKRSGRHGNVMEMMNEPVGQREFAEWTMAFSPTSASDLLKLSQASWSAQADSSGMELLRGFWTGSR